MGRSFQPGKVALVVTGLIVATCCWLGFWQLERANQKAEHLLSLARKSEQSFKALAPVSKLEDPGGYRIELRGTFDNEHSFLLDNRLQDGIAGYHVLTPFYSLASEQWVLVNRGWLPRGKERATLPALPPVPGIRQIAGQTYQYSAKTFVLAEDNLDNPHWPVRIQKVDTEKFSKLLGKPLAPFEIRLAPETKVETGTQFVRDWQTGINMTPERHQAYALQWFALAIAAVLVFVFASLKRRPRSGEDHHGGQDQSDR